MHTPDTIESLAFSLSPVEYAGLVQTTNDNYRTHLAELLTGVELPPNSALLVVGSDGKRERHRQSRTEFTVIDASSDIPDPTVFAPLGEALLSLPISIDPGHTIRPFEYKPVGVIAEPLSIVEGRARTIYPDRVLNTERVIGDPDVWIAARAQTMYEMSAANPLGSSIRKAMKNQLRDYRGTMETGLFRETRNFVHDPPIQFYEERANSPILSLGFKPGPIRAVQRKTDIFVADAVRQHGQNPAELAVHLPRATHERVQFLMDCHLGPQQQGDIVESYDWFLREYHRAQDAYASSGITVAIESDPQEFTEAFGAIQAYLRQ